jgi:hypothetical protein
MKLITQLKIRLMTLNGTHQLPAYADDVNLLGDSTDSKKHEKI